MAEASPNDRTKLPAGDDDAQPSEDLDVLRRIIVGPQQTRIRHLEQRLDDAGMRAHELSHVLPDAIALCTAKDQKIARSLSLPSKILSGSPSRKTPRCWLTLFSR